MKIFRKEKGFVLLELVTVISLLGVLTLIGLPRFLGSLEAGRKTQCDASRRAIEAAERDYFSAKGTSLMNVKTLYNQKYLNRNPVCPSKGSYVWISKKSTARDYPNVGCSLHEWS